MESSGYPVPGLMSPIRVDGGKPFAKGKPFTRFSAFSPFPGRCYSSLRFVIPDICAKDGPKKNNIFIHIPKRFPMSSGFTQMPKLSRNHQPQIKIFP